MINCAISNSGNNINNIYNNMIPRSTPGAVASSEQAVVAIVGVGGSWSNSSSNRDFLILVYHEPQ